MEVKLFGFEIRVVLQLKSSLKNNLQLLIRCGKGEGVFFPPNNGTNSVLAHLAMTKYARKLGVPTRQPACLGGLLAKWEGIMYFLSLTLCVLMRQGLTVKHTLKKAQTRFL